MKQYDMGSFPICLTKVDSKGDCIKICELLYELFEIVNLFFKDFSFELNYIIDSLPVAKCNNMYITNFKILKDKKWRDFRASKLNYFYELKYNCSKDGIKIVFHFTLSKTGVTKALEKTIVKLPLEASLYEDIALKRKMYLIKDSMQVKR